jgi:hypothetical protein
MANPKAKNQTKTESIIAAVDSENPPMVSLIKGKKEVTTVPLSVQPHIREGIFFSGYIRQRANDYQVLHSLLPAAVSYDAASGKLQVTAYFSHTYPNNSKFWELVYEYKKMWDHVYERIPIKSVSKKPYSEHILPNLMQFRRLIAEVRSMITKFQEKKYIADVSSQDWYIWTFLNYKEFPTAFRVSENIVVETYDPIPTWQTQKTAVKIPISHWFAFISLFAPRRMAGMWFEYFETVAALEGGDVDAQIENLLNFMISRLNWNMSTLMHVIDIQAYMATIVLAIALWANLRAPEIGLAASHFKHVFTFHVHSETTDLNTATAQVNDVITSIQAGGWVRSGGSIDLFALPFGQSETLHFCKLVRAWSKDGKMARIRLAAPFEAVNVASDGNALPITQAEYSYLSGVKLPHADAFDTILDFDLLAPAKVGFVIEDGYYRHLAARPISYTRWTERPTCSELFYEATDPFDAFHGLNSIYKGNAYPVEMVKSKSTQLMQYDGEGKPVFTSLAPSVSFKPKIVEK